jgi:hypothetical protein
MEIGGFFKMAEGLVGKQAEKQTEADLEVLKRLLESGLAQASRVVLAPLYKYIRLTPILKAG